MAGVGRSETVNGDGLPQLGRFFEAALHPRLDAPFLDLTLDATLTTLAYAVLGSALSLVIGALVGAAASQVLRRPQGAAGGRRSTVGWLAARAALVVPRGIHEVVWGLLFLSVLGLDPLVAVLAIGIPYGAVTAKVFTEILDDVPRAPFAALRAGGAGRVAALLYGVVPAALPELLSYAFYRFECAIRGAAILGLVGAGGLGFQLALSFQALQYGEMWTLLYALALLSGAADLWSGRVRARARGRQASPRDSPGAGAGPRRDRLLTASVLVAALLVPLSALRVDLDPTTLWDGRARRLLGDLLASAWPPDLDAATVDAILAASLDTVAMSVIAITIAVVGGAALAFPAAATRHVGRPGRGRLRDGATVLSATLTRGLLLFPRAVPPPVTAFLLLLVLFPGPLPGALALGLYNLGILGRLMAESVESFDDGAERALRTAGARPGQAFLYGMLPGISLRFAAYGLYRWEVAIRETVVVGVVGAGGLGVLLQERIAGFDYGGVTSVLVALILLTLAVDMVSAAVRRALR